MSVSIGQAGPSPSQLSQKSRLIDFSPERPVRALTIPAWLLDVDQLRRARGAVILWALLNEIGPQYVTEELLAKWLRCDENSVSKYLRLLRNLGLVRRRRAREVSAPRGNTPGRFFYEALTPPAYAEQTEACA